MPDSCAPHHQYVRAKGGTMPRDANSYQRPVVFLSLYTFTLDGIASPFTT